MTCGERALAEDYIEILTDFEITPEILGGRDIDICTIAVGQGIYVSYVKQNERPDSAAGATYFMPRCFGLMADIIPDAEPDDDFDMLALNETGIRQMQLPPLSLTGQGVVLGFLDTGIRYEEEAFRYPDGSSRILGIWDQTIQSGEPPEGQVFGTEYTKEMLDAALATEHPRELVPTTDTVGHGTSLASVAAGSAVVNGSATSDISRSPGRGGFLGAAPDSMIAVVKLREAKEYLRRQWIIPQGAHAYSEGDILLAFKYLNSFAISLRRPLVVCFGLGTSSGSHNGDAILARYMQNMVENRSRAIAVCGGNEGNSAHHFEGQTCIRGGDAYEDVEIRVSENVPGFIAELWGRIPQIYTVTVISPSGENFPTGTGLLGQNLNHQYLYEKTRVTIIYNVVEEGSGDERISIRFEKPTAGIWTIRVFGVGECAREAFHVWLPVRNFLTTDTYFLRPNPYVTLTVPAYAGEVIAVTVYNDANQAFWAESGRGFGRNGGLKPDMAAPGVEIPTILGRMTGSSAAAALTAGAAAQFMQWAVVERNEEYVFGRDVRNYLIRGAIREENINYPNREWGFGRLNLANTFEVMRLLR